MSFLLRQVQGSKDRRIGGNGTSIPTKRKQFYLPESKELQINTTGHWGKELWREGDGASLTFTTWAAVEESGDCREPWFPNMENREHKTKHADLLKESVMWYLAQSSLGGCQCHWFGAIVFKHWN